MKKKDIKQLANKIFILEQKLHEATQVKDIQSYIKEIEIIMEGLSLEEGLELNDIVISLFQKQ